MSIQTDMANPYEDQKGHLQASSRALLHAPLRRRPNWVSQAGCCQSKPQQEEGRDNRLRKEGYGWYDPQRFNEQHCCFPLLPREGALRASHSFSQEDSLSMRVSIPEGFRYPKVTKGRLNGMGRSAGQEMGFVLRFFCFVLIFLLLCLVSFVSFLISLRL